MDVSRIENLLYGCSFHDDEVAMTEADAGFVSKKQNHFSSPRFIVMLLRV